MRSGNIEEIRKGKRNIFPQEKYETKENVATKREKGTIGQIYEEFGFIQNERVQISGYLYRGLNSYIQEKKYLNINYIININIKI